MCRDQAGCGGTAAGPTPAAGPSSWWSAPPRSTPPGATPTPGGQGRFCFQPEDPPRNQNIKKCTSSKVQLLRKKMRCLPLAHFPPAVHSHVATHSKSLPPACPANPPHGAAGSDGYFKESQRPGDLVWQVANKSQEKSQEKKSLAGGSRRILA